MTTNDTPSAAALTATIMNQVQVYASAWSLVGGQFDQGNALEIAEHEKTNLRTLIGNTIAMLERPAEAVTRPALLDAADVLRDAVQANSIFAIGIVHGIASLANGKPVAPPSLDRCYAPSCGKWDGNPECTCAKTAPSPADERTAFEAWYLRDMPHETYLLKRSHRHPEMYDDDSVEDAWTGWQARAASANETGAAGARERLFAAACECLSPDQMDKFDALFDGDDDTCARFLRCVLKRSPAMAADAVASAADLRALISDDSYAMSFQTMGQYRAALLRTLSAAPQPAHADAREGLTRKHIMRMFTYRQQPDNVGAWRLGEACRAAKPGGDPIDHGLSLLKELQAKGYGVVELPSEISAAATAEGAQS